MQPYKSTPQDLFSKPARYLCPIFQRGYVWTLSDQIKPLWRDILYQAQKSTEAAALNAETIRKHFLGTIVLKTDATGGARYVPKSEVIDGQQRLTTLQILLVALRDVIAPLQDQQLTRKLENLTSNGADVTDPDETYKVWPTSAFQQEFVTISTARSAMEVRKRFPPLKIGRKTYTRPGLVQAYLFFCSAIGSFIRGEEYQEPIEDSDIDSLDDIIAELSKADPKTQANPAIALNPTRAELLIDIVTNQLQLIELRLESHDDAQIIFETLNARGAPLKAGDLVRNFVFLQAARCKQNPEALYQAHWKSFDEAIDPIADARRRKKKDIEIRFWKMEERQGRLTSVRLDLFLFHYLTLRRASEYKFGHLYQFFRDWWEKGPERDVGVELEKLAAAAVTFRTLIERQQDTRFGMFAHRLRVLDTTTVFPLVLLLGERENTMEESLFETALTHIESYLIRRTICGLSPKAYNRVFLSVLQDVIKAPPEQSEDVLRQKLLALEGDTQNWPTDSQVKDKWIYEDAYLRLRSGRVQMILEGLEIALDSSRQETRPVFDVGRMPSIEHVWPQYGDLIHWPVRMDIARPEIPIEDVVRLKRVIQSFGNLTLLTQPLNSSIGRGPFHEKRSAITRDSRLQLNSYFRDTQDIWTDKSIEVRGISMFDLFRTAWPHPLSSK